MGFQWSLFLPIVYSISPSDEADGYYEVVCFTVEGGARCPAYGGRMEMKMAQDAPPTGFGGQGRMPRLRWEDGDEGGAGCPAYDQYALLPPAGETQPSG